MLVGHSLGGIAAAGLASSPRFTQAHQVTHVVTMGSPVGRMPVPAGIEVLSLEHTQDAVPRLDGQPNPDRATWVTVSRDLDGAGVDRASQAHDTALLRRHRGRCRRRRPTRPWSTWRATSARVLRRRHPRGAGHPRLRGPAGPCHEPRAAAGVVAQSDA